MPSILHSKGRLKFRLTRSDSCSVVPSNPEASCLTPAARSIEDDSALVVVALWTAMPMNVLVSVSKKT